MISDFAKQFVEMEEENVRLKLEVAEAKKLATDAWLKADVVEKDRAKLKKSLDKEVVSREATEAKIDEKGVQLRRAIESLLSKFFGIFSYIYVVASAFLDIVVILLLSLFLP